MLHPETLMLNYGYDPQLSEGAAKPPIFLTSTFVFRTAEDGQDFFDFVSGRREPPEGIGAGLVYSRFNHPNSEIVEDRLSVYERTENCALFSSGIAAIAITILAIGRPGEVILHHRTIKEATAKRSHYARHDQLESHLADFINAYNYGRRLKTLKGLTPYEYICKCWI